MSQISDVFREISRGEALKRDPALADACAPGFQIYFSQKIEQKIGRDDKRVLSKALKDQYCDMRDLTCLCDLKKKHNLNPQSIMGPVRSRVDCKCAIKIGGTYKAPKDVDEMLVRMGKRDLVKGAAADGKDGAAAAGGGDAGLPAAGTPAQGSPPGAPPPQGATLPAQQAPPS